MKTTSLEALLYYNYFYGKKKDKCLYLECSSSADEAQCVFLSDHYKCNISRAIIYATDHERTCTTAAFMTLWLWFAKAISLVPSDRSFRSKSLKVCQPCAPLTVRIMAGVWNNPEIRTGTSAFACQVKFHVLNGILMPKETNLPAQSSCVVIRTVHQFFFLVLSACGMNHDYALLHFFLCMKASGVVPRGTKKERNHLTAVVDLYLWAMNVIQPWCFHSANDREDCNGMVMVVVLIAAMMIMMFKLMMMTTTIKNECFRTCEKPITLEMTDTWDSDVCWKRSHVFKKKCTFYSLSQLWHFSDSAVARKPEQDTSLTPENGGHSFSCFLPAWRRVQW